MRKQKTPKSDKSDFSQSTSGIRLQKFMADMGLASRRAAEEMIRLGEVTVNGRLITELGFRVIPGKDAVKVRGKLLHFKAGEEKVYIKLFKPTGVLASLSDHGGRTTVKDLLVGVKTRVYPVEKLDYDSEGLLLLTNDGELAQSLMQPKKEIRRAYLIKVNGKPTSAHFQKMRIGVPIAGGRIKFHHVEKTKSGEQYDWLKIVVGDATIRQIRLAVHKVGFDVLKIQLVGIGRLSLGRLERGQFKIIPKEEALLALK